MFLDLGGGNPFDTQFFAYLGRLAQGDLGTSYKFRDRPVSAMLGESLSNTLWLILPAQVLSIIMGRCSGWSPPGAGEARSTSGRSRSGSCRGHCRRSSSASCSSSSARPVRPADRGPHDHRCRLRIGVGWRARSRQAPVAADPDLDPCPAWRIPADHAKQRHRGLHRGLHPHRPGEGASTTWHVIRDHALRNAMLPMVTLIALNLGFTVSGAIQVESVFSWPGLGALTVNAVAQRDYPVLQGAVPAARDRGRHRQPRGRAAVRLARPAGVRGMTAWSRRDGADPAARPRPRARGAVLARSPMGMIGGGC